MQTPVPTPDEKLFPSLADRGERLRAVEAMLRFADKHGLTATGHDLKSMVHEGHKY